MKDLKKVKYLIEENFSNYLIAVGNHDVGYSGYQSDNLKENKNFESIFNPSVSIFDKILINGNSTSFKSNKASKNIDYNQLKKNQNSIVLSEKVLFKKPTKFSEALALLAPGRLIEIKKCDDKWCKISTLKYSGWVTKKDLWGLKKF